MAKYRRLGLNYEAEMRRKKAKKEKKRARRAKEEEDEQPLRRRSSRVQALQIMEAERRQKDEQRALQGWDSMLL